MNKVLDFKAYWQRVRLALPWLLLASFAAGVVAYVIASSYPPAHQVHFSYLISLSEREAAGEFRFDGFYALQATDLFAQTLARWIQTPEVIVAAYREAGLTPPTENPRQLTRLIKADKTAPQLVQVTVEETSEEKAGQLTTALQTVMEKNVAAYDDQGIPAIAFRVVATDPWAGKNEVSVPVITTATFVFVFLLALNGVLLLYSVRLRE